MKRQALTLRQAKTMKKHSEHHSKKHLAFMESLMLKGASFSEAHKKAMKNVGK
tara:strand:+ start:679 stop:837 length:159 start_codon:yes stop_codon:yes gene_type:complete